LNLLGHAALASLDPEALIGNLGGDLIKGRLENRFSPDLERGLRSHRLIDAFSDSHPSQKELSRHMPPTLKRFTGIISDIAFGRILAQQWNRRMALPFPEFKREIYDRLGQLPSNLPENLIAFADRIKAKDLIANSFSKTYLDNAFGYLSRRFPPIVDAPHEIQANPAVFQHAFEAVWPDLINELRGRDPSAAQFCRTP
jgi:acyl carrier protein phosphodiesterase